MDNNLWPSANEINNHIANLGTRGLSITEKERIMADKIVLASKYMLAQALQDFDKSDLQNIIDNVKHCTVTLFLDYGDTATIIYVPKNNGFFAVITNLGILLDFNFEIKPKTKRKTLGSFCNDFMNLFFCDAATRALLKESEPKYDCNITVNILDPLKKLVNLYDFERIADKIARDVFSRYSNSYDLPFCEMKAEYIYNLKIAKNADFPLFNAFANGELDADDYLPSFYILISEKLTRINNYFESEHHIAIDMVKEWSRYENNNEKYDNYPISKLLVDSFLKYNLDILVKKYVGIPTALFQKDDSNDAPIVQFRNINKINIDYRNYYTLADNNVFSNEDSVVLTGYQHYNTAKNCAENIIRNEAERFKTDYEQYIKEYADFINVFKTGAENLANDLWDTHLSLRNDFKEKLEDIDHKLSTIEVI